MKARRFDPAGTPSARTEDTCSPSPYREEEADEQLTVDVWDLDTGQRHDLTWPTAKFEPTVNGGYNRGVVFSPDGSWLFALQPTGRITAVQWATSRTIEFDVVTPLTQPVNIGVNPFGVLVVGS